MTVKFLSKFNKDLDKINDKNIKNKIRKIILEAESTRTIQTIQNSKKLKGDKHSYRIRLGDYRIGIYYENGVMEFARLAHRKDIYKIFP